MEPDHNKKMHPAAIPPEKAREFFPNVYTPPADVYDPFENHNEARAHKRPRHDSES